MTHYKTYFCDFYDQITIEKVDRCISNLFVFRPLLGQFLCDFENLDTVLIGEARSLITMASLIIVPARLLNHTGKSTRHD